jgi:hypothetical protein
MYSTLGFEDIIKNVYRISAPYASSGAVQTIDDLRLAYHEFLAKYHPGLPVNRADDLFIAEASREEAVVDAYAGNNVLNDLKQDAVIGTAYSHDVKLERIAIARDALEDLLAADEKFGQVFRLVIHSIIVRPSRQDVERSARGGSSSGAIGTIWLTVGTGISKYDLMEMFVHELTHNLMYIDELNYPHYNYDKVLDRKTQAFSAILKRSRPMDKVIHSIVVASELLLGRRTFLPDGQIATVHPSDPQLIHDTQVSLESVYSMPDMDNVVMPRVREILDRCIDKCGYSVSSHTRNAARVSSLAQG